MQSFTPGLLVVTALAASVSAQQNTRSWVEVTPAGVRVRQELAPSAPAQSHAAAVGQLGLSNAQLRWIYTNPAGTPWITQTISVGNQGAFAWLGQDLNAERLSFVATTDNFGSPPDPIYEPLFDGSRLAVRAADKGAAAVLSEIDAGSSTLDLHYFSGYSTTPVHTIAQPAAFEIAIADSGTRFTSGYSTGSGQARVDVYDTSSATPTLPIQTLTAAELNFFRQHDISGDGSTVLLASDTQNHIYDVATGTQTFSDSSTVSHDAHAINFDGSAWGRGGFDVRAWVHDGTTYNEVLNFVDSGLGFMVSTACDIAGDGSTFAAAAWDANDVNQFRLYVWDLSATGSSLRWTYSATGSGTLPDLPTAVSVSDDGRWIAVGSWGTELAGHPEALLFDRDAGNVPVQALDTPGSVNDLDLSGDGQFWVVGTKSVHAGVLGNGGEGYSLDRGDQGHSLAGTTSIGRTFDLETHGSSGDFVVQLLTTALLPVPLPIAGFSGALEIDLTTNIGPAVVVGTIGGTGVVTRTLTLPADVNLVGQTLYSQSVRFGPKAFDNHLRLSITP